LQRKNHLNQTFIIVLHANFQGCIIVDTILNGIDHQEMAGFISLPETNKLHVQIHGWKMILSFCDAIFSGAMLVLGGVRD